MWLVQYRVDHVYFRDWPNSRPFSQSWIYWENQMSDPAIILLVWLTWDEIGMNVATGRKGVWQPWLNLSHVVYRVVIHLYHDLSDMVKNNQYNFITKNSSNYSSIHPFFLNCSVLISIMGVFFIILLKIELKRNKSCNNWLLQRQNEMMSVKVWLSQKHRSA